MEVILIRHGQSEANRTHDREYPVYCGRYDCSLTSEGMAQAAALREAAVLQHADAVFCSPLKRAVQTAELLGAENITIDSRLQERTLGEFDGRAEHEVRNDPAYSRYFNDPQYMDFRSSFTQKAPGGESYADVEQRVCDFWRELRETNYRKVIIVAHAVAIRCLLKTISGLTEAQTLKLTIPNCEPIRLLTDCSDALSVPKT